MTAAHDGRGGLGRRARQHGEEEGFGRVLRYLMSILLESVMKDFGCLPLVVRNPGFMMSSLCSW